ncbi:stage V sporulation protein B [Clostridium amylolyticum]|uniref:Stage V sporulation protein B n=1 Tax=Clostridium amylolyticum TaxID=1121298 RepID=A0A1M6LI68_9CLOT|nr:polysaccharide biosynthesis protein [Clostridium amylolyticum]SHJ70892.1 stage V sporulation protein B [Clostridium amylolyticum]
MKKQSLIKGTLILGIAGIFAKFLGLFFRWPLIMLIGEEGVGLYQMSYPLYMFFISAAAGVPLAVSKLVSEKNAVNDIEGSFQVFREALKLMIFLGTGLSIILFVFAKPIVSILKWDDKAYYSLIGISFAPMVIYVMDVFRGFFQGQQNMNPTAISQIIEQIGRVIGGVALAFILYPKGIEYSAAGAAFGATAGGILGNIYLIGKYLKFKTNMPVKKLRVNSYIMNKLLKIAMPISMGAAAASIMGLIDSALVPQKLLDAGFTQNHATVLFAQLTGKAGLLVNIPLTLSVALGYSIVPIIAEAYALRRREEIYYKIEMSIKLSAAIALPCTLGLYYMAGPIFNLIFPGKGEGYLILKYLSLIVPFIIITQTTTAILQATGHYIKPVINILIACVVKVVITLILVPMPEINIFGAVIASIAAYITSAFLNILDMQKKLYVKLDYYKLFVRPVYASIIMILGVLYTYSTALSRTASTGISCLISIFMGIIIYVIFIMLFGVIEYGYVIKKIDRRTHIK